MKLPELKAEQEKIIKLQTYISSLLLVKVTLSMIHHKIS